MNLTADHPFDNAVIHHYIYENAIFDVFLTGKPLFRRTEPIQAFATIAFSPFHAAFLTAILLHGYQPEHRQNAVGRHTGYICTDPCPESLSSAQRIPVSSVFPAPASAALHIPVAAAFPFYGWPETQSNAPSINTASVSHLGNSESVMIFHPFPGCYFYFP